MYRVLYVDDEQDLLNLGKIFLEMSGDFTVDTLNIPKFTLEKLQTASFDAIVSDYQMPEMNGITLLQEVRRIYPALPFILFTGRGREEIVIQAINNGADFYLQKGGDPQSQFAELAHKIRQAVQRRQAEISLVESETKYRTLAENISDIHFSATKEGLITYIGSQVKNLGYTPDEIISRRIVDFIYPADRESAVNALSTFLATGVSSLLEFRILDTRGISHWMQVNSTRIIDTSGTVTGFSGILRDITERKRAEEALRQSEKKYRNIVENIQEVVYRTDRNGKLIMVSPRGAKLAGYDSAEEMIGLDVAIDVYKNSKEREDFLAALTEKGFVENFPLILKSRDGNSHIVTASSHFYYDDLGNVLGVEGILHDITELWEKEQDLLASEERYRTLYDDNPVMLFTLDSEGKVISVNKAGASELGYTVGELVGQSVLKVFYADDHRAVAEQLQVCLKSPGEGFRWQSRKVKKDGSLIWVDEHARAMVNPSGNPRVIVVCHDITDQKWAEDALRQSEQRYRTLIDSANEAVLVIQNGMICFANAMAEEISGYTREELAARSFLEFIHPDDRMKVGKEHLKRLRGENLKDHYTFRIISSTGSILWMEIGASLTTWEGEKAVLVFLSDITERKQAEEALFSSRQMLLAVLDTIPQRVFWKDRNSVFLGCNKSLAYDAGYKDPADLVGKTDYDHASAETADLYRADDRQVMETGRPKINYEETQVRPDGNRAWLRTSKVPIRDKEGKAIGVLGTYEDITDWKQKENALRESEKRSRLILDSANDAIFIHEVSQDGPGPFIEVNPQACQMLGYTREELLEMGIRDIDVPEQNKRVPEILGSLFSSGKVVFQTEFLTRDRRRILVEVSNRLIELDGRQAVLCIARDLTDQKRAEQVLEATNRKLNLLSSITRHDILNQLTALIGYIDISREYLDDKKTLLKFLEKEAKAATTIGHQIRFTKEYHELGVKAPAWQNVHESIQQAVAGLPMRDIRVEVDRTDLEIFADPLFGKVFYNLIDNALRYGGESMKTIRVSSQESGTGLTIVCEDDGVGIPDDDKKRLFTRGFGNTNGLGLFLSREILSITGITITENGTSGKGARFEITAPKGMYRFSGMEKERKTG